MGGTEPATALAHTVYACATSATYEWLGRG